MPYKSLVMGQTQGTISGYAKTAGVSYSVTSAWLYRKPGNITLDVY